LFWVGSENFLPLQLISFSIKENKTFLNGNPNGRCNLPPSKDGSNSNVSFRINGLINQSFQISIYGVVCSICFANLSIQEQKAKPKNNGMRIIDNQGVII
jgi:hypothetical protein